MRIRTVFLLLCGLPLSLAAQQVVANVAASGVENAAGRVAVAHAVWGQVEDAPPPTVGSSGSGYISSSLFFANSAASGAEPVYNRPVIRYGARVDYQPRAHYGANLRYWPETRLSRSYDANNRIQYGETFSFRRQRNRPLMRRFETDATYGDRIQYGHRRIYGLGR